jgi:hypothetical protein
MTVYDAQNERTENTIIAVVPCCTFLFIIPVTTTCTDLPGDTAALEEEGINYCII